MDLDWCGETSLSRRCIGQLGLCYGKADMNMMSAGAPEESLEDERRNSTMDQRSSDSTGGENRENRPRRMRWYLVIHLGRD